MSEIWNGKLIGIYTDTHPHWVVDNGCYAVTLRCHGSLPKPVQAQLQEIGQSLQAVEPASDEARAYHRRHFAILEHALDRATGFCPFTEAKSARAMMDFLETYDEEGLSLAHWVIMPNHLHLVTAPFQCHAIDNFRTAWSRLKSRSARLVNQAIGREGRFWQSSWYDRWIRDEHEHSKRLDYLARNPVKAAICGEPEAYPYRK